MPFVNVQIEVKGEQGKSLGDVKIVLKPQYHQPHTPQSFCQKLSGITHTGGTLTFQNLPTDIYEFEVAKENYSSFKEEVCILPRPPQLSSSPVKEPSCALQCSQTSLATQQLATGFRIFTIKLLKIPWFKIATGEIGTT